MLTGSVLDRYTTLARNVVTTFADMEARRLHHPNLGTEHILLGLAHQERDIAASTLVELGASYPVLNGKVLEYYGEPCGKTIKNSSNILSRDIWAETIMCKSLYVAREFRYQSVGTQHVLFAMLMEPHGGGYEVLNDLGIKLKEVKRKVIDIIVRSN